jgi:isopenicillin-N epimerase
MLRRQFLQHAALAPAALGPAVEDEAAWRQFRAEQFLLPDWRAYLNTGSVGSAPRRVVEATNRYLSQGASYSTDQYPRWGYEAMESHREALAGFLGAKRQEIALTHNATESMSLIANGLELKPGDEVLITDQEHPSGRGCWQLKQARMGIRIREARVPVPPRNAAEIHDAVVGAIRPETKVLSFSGITTHTGLLFPVASICAAARERGVITVVDGAHMPGQVGFRLDELGCDVFAGSLHKWMLTPPGCGLLYVRESFQSRLWPTIVVEGWQNQKDALKYMQLGCNNRAELEGMLEALQFIGEVGAERMRARIHYLARYAAERARAIPYLKLLTAVDDSLYGGMVAFEVDRPDYAPLWKKLGERKVWTLRGQKIRVSSHIHTRQSDLDLLFDTVKEVYG